MVRNAGVTHCVIHPSGKGRESGLLDIMCDLFLKIRSKGEDVYNFGQSSLWAYLYILLKWKVAVQNRW
jgi:hypothetical protein